MGSQSGQSEQQSISLSLLNSLIYTASLTVIYLTFKLVGGFLKKRDEMNAFGDDLKTKHVDTSRVDLVIRL